MTIGIGGAGTKLALTLDPNATAVNVSQAELTKSEAANTILAAVHSRRGDNLRGSRKDPQVGTEAFLSIKAQLLELSRGNLIFSSTGGGTGNGITSGLLASITHAYDVPSHDRTAFALVLPYAPVEPADFITNTINFLGGPLSEAIDSGNTGNIYLFSNRPKFESRLSEADYNSQLITSLQEFLSIPDKNEEYELLEGHIDHEDFALYTSRPFFNHYCTFAYDPDAEFGPQLEANHNLCLLPPDNPIEALFLLELPDRKRATAFYDILDYFSRLEVTPDHSVIFNPQIRQPQITVSLLYSRKPDDLVEDFQRTSEAHTEAKLRKSLKQHVSLPTLDVDMEQEAKRVAEQEGESEQVLNILRRLGKL